MAANFALTPGLTGQDVLDYRNSDNRKLYKDATKQLSEENFDCDESSLLQFLKDLEDRAAEYGWNAEGGILSVDTDPDDDQAEEESLLDLLHAKKWDLGRTPGKRAIMGWVRGFWGSNACIVKEATTKLFTVWYLNKNRVSIWNFRLQNHYDLMLPALNVLVFEG